jgi:hypothetical protein
VTYGMAGTTLVNKWLDMLSATAFTAPPASYIKIHVGDPGAAGTANPSVGDASRKVITYAAASGGAKSMNGTGPTWTNGGTTETIVAISSNDASSAGNFLFDGLLTTPQAWVSANTLQLTGLTVSIAPIAA